MTSPHSHEAGRRCHAVTAPTYLPPFCRDAAARGIPDTKQGDAATARTYRQPAGPQRAETRLLYVEPSTALFCSFFSSTSPNSSDVSPYRPLPASCRPRLRGRAHFDAGRFGSCRLYACCQFYLFPPTHLHYRPGGARYARRSAICGSRTRRWPAPTRRGCAGLGWRTTRRHLPALPATATYTCAFRLPTAHTAVPTTAVPVSHAPHAVPHTSFTSPAHTWPFCCCRRPGT